MADIMNSTLVLLALLSGDGEVPAHKLPDLERMRRRMHAGDAELRRLRAEMDGAIGRNGTGLVVVGKHNPELLMRWEIMDHVSARLHDERTIAQYDARWTERGATTILGDNYVERLQKALAELVETEKEFKRLQTRIDSAKPGEIAALQQALQRVTNSRCPLRARALAAARNEFGSEQFDRFLYEAVAPDVISIGSGGKTPERAYELMRWYEDGCQ